jgi:hypothetical protein
MKHLIITDARIAGHCTTGMSNKVWTACLAVESESQTDTVQAVNLAALPSTAEVVFLCGHGPYGAALRLEEPKKMARTAAQNLLRKKWQEKAGKGYASVPFEPFVRSFGNPWRLPLLLPGSALAPTSAPETPTLLQTPVASIQETPAVMFRHTAALVKAVTFEQMLMLFREGSTVSEKANGERCLIEFYGTEMVAYNRRGRRTTTPPEGALALQRLGHSFVVDGERLIREQAGHYVLFDVLEWDGEDLTALAYRKRLTRLVRSMHRAGLLKETRLTPTIAQAQHNSTTPHLSVLLGVQGETPTQSALQEIQAAGGEGVVIRSLDAPYATGGFKYKFLEDIDAFVIGIEPGVSEGSLILGMVRPSDHAIIEVGRVRSGLTDANIQHVRGMILRGENPVFRVTYLPASTIGITLVQPKTSIDALRTDKETHECTTDQFGPEKAMLIAQARPVVGIRVH